MDEFGAKLENLALFPDGADAATDTITGLEDKHLPSGLGQHARGPQARHAGTDDEYSLRPCLHMQFGCYPVFAVS